MLKSPNSTGGVIALGLGAKKWSIEACTHHFEYLCQKAFTRRTGGNIPGVGWLIEKWEPLLSLFWDPLSCDNWLTYQTKLQSFKVRDSTA